MITETAFEFYPLLVGPLGLLLVARAALPKLIEWRRRHAAYRELRSLDDRMLKDIGLTRSELYGVAYLDHVPARRSGPQPTAKLKLSNKPSPRTREIDRDLAA